VIVTLSPAADPRTFTAAVDVASSDRSIKLV